ncbi:YncE family protein [Alkalimonas amylolytica]|uniref:DNA-binding beta-propeller fold protein YncE n=1 Tax=Alkalimonas amylolytica TaxID=152573 RepID=A0A1H4E283_ALKAM|nr:hypothetical protein [Alkalimonas amylolytica]SEA78502.1 hypothetical protein SAMN04488051_106142 [Alkalimonas amylolytica]
MKQLLLTGKFCLLLLSMLLIACGGGSDSDSGPTPPPVNTQPNTFSFNVQADVEPGATVTSNSITVSGINAAATISIQGGEYSIDNGDFASGSSTVNNAAQIRVRHQASAEYASSQTTTLTIGGVSANFVSTTRNQPSAVGTGTPPQATVLFPWSQSKATAGTLTVRGTATSRNGISDLRVNGVAATVHSRSAAAQRVSAQSFHAQGSNEDDEEQEEEEFEWTADVEIESNSATELKVSVSDADGAENNDAASVRVDTLEAPTFLVYDNLNERLIGVLGSKEIVAIDPSNLSYQPITTADFISELNFDPVYNRIIYSTHHENTVSLHEVDLVLGSQKSLVTYTPELAPDVKIIMARSVFDPINQLAFVLLKLLEDGSFYATDRLYQFNLADDTSRLLSASYLDDSPRMTISHMTMLGTRLYAAASNRQLIEINTETGERTTVMGLPDFSPMAMAAGSRDDQLFIAGFQGILKIELAFPLSIMLSRETSTTLYPTSQIRGALLLDEETLLVLDPDFGNVLQVDTRTGERSAFIRSGIGAGRSIMMPRYLTFADEGDTLYVLDNGSNAADVLFAVDLTSGDRTMIADINQDRVNYHSGLFFHAKNNALLVGLDDAIISVALSDGSTSVVSGMGAGHGPELWPITGGDFDAESETLYMAKHSLTNAIFKIDVTTGQRIVLGFDGSAGIAGVIEGVNDVALDAENQQLYLSSQSQSTIYRLDLETLETEMVLDRCMNNYGQNILNVDESGIYKINYDAAGQRLLILSGQLASYDFATQSCQILGQRHEYINAMPLENGTFLTVGQGALKQLDPVTQEQVIISK